jgi:membrane protein
VNRKLLNGRFVLGLLKDTFNDWLEDGALRLSAALAYYSIFSIAPLLVICLGIVGWVGGMLGPDTIDKYVYGELGHMVGAKSADVIKSMVVSASKPGAGKMATIIGFAVLLFGASGVFGQLKDALNTIWEVKTKSGLGIKGFIRQRVLSFGMVLVIGFLLLVSLVLSTVIAGFTKMVATVVPFPWLFAPLGILLSVAIISVLFALIFKVLPDATVEWRQVWVGAIVTAILFEIGKFFLGMYLGREGASSSYGAAGAVVLVLLWVYYGSCIIFFGAEFTQVYAKAMGEEIRPNEFAEPVTSEMRAQQGLSPSKREKPPYRPPDIVTVPVYTPPAPPGFPHSLREVPGYFRESPTASLVAAVGCGFAVGMVSRMMNAPVARDPVERISHGSREVARGSSALALAGMALLSKLAQSAWKVTRRQLQPERLRETGRHLRESLVPTIVAGAVLTISLGNMAPGAEKKPAKTSGPSDEITRLQVFLDRASFGPGKIDGRDGEFTRKALAHYRASSAAATGTGNSAPPNAETPNTLDTTGLDLSSVDAIFTEYTVTPEDQETVGELPDARTAQANAKWLPYRTLVEAVAEKFHTDIDYLKELNPSFASRDLKPGDVVKVPNVIAFEISALKQKQKTASAKAEADSAKRRGVNEIEEEGAAEKTANDITVQIRTSESMLLVREKDQLRAAFPITSGSDRTASPLGKWTIKGIARFPEFRWDEKMLNEGERSSDYLLLPPGPNNPVGVMWIALNKKGIGIHGTDSPDQIGRSASHGCIRLANWDVVRLAELVKPGVSVTIE